jgi:hypothetical protein
LGIQDHQPSGIAAGVLTHVLIKAARGRWRDAGLLVWVPSVAFMAYFALHPIEGRLEASSSGAGDLLPPDTVAAA